MSRMKTAAVSVIVLCVVIGCACVFPGNLVRRETKVESSLYGNYGRTEGGRVLTQSFYAQTAYLSQLAFDIGFPNGKPEEGNLRVILKDENTGKVMTEKQLALTDVNDGEFTYVPLQRWLVTGNLYSYSVEVQSDENNLIQAIYTLNEEDCALGCELLSFDGERVSGQAVTSFVYEFPLNKKNVICLWAFFWAIGLISVELVTGKKSFLYNRVFSKAEELLDKLQYPALVLELLVILALIIRICRNEAVHWDEAFTWQIVTRNDLAGMIRATAADVHPPLYYMMVMAAMKLFGQNIFVAKMVSVAGAFATGILGITLIRKRWGVKTAIPFLLIAGLGTQMVYYNVDVRMYSWSCFFVLAAGAFAYEIIVTGKTGWWVAFVFVSLCGVYTQYFNVIPLALLYLFLLIFILANNRKQWKMWGGCSIAAVVGYLPWLRVVVDTLNRDAAELAAVQGQQMKETFSSLCEWAFKNNIELSSYMPIVLFAVAVVCLVREHQAYSRPEKIYLTCIGAIFFLFLGICAILSPHMGHFWTNRYLVCALMYIWLFVFAVLARKSLLAWGAIMVWGGILALSSYTVQQAVELGTIPWIEHTRQLLEQVQEEDKIVYTFDTFDVLYQYYVPDAEFIWYEDVDFLDMGEEFYVIAWGGKDFSRELYHEGVIEKEVLGTMRFEQGITADLWKIRICQTDTLK